MSLVASSRHESSHVEGEEATEEVDRDIAGDDTLCQALGNGSLSYSWLSDADGVVLSRGKRQQRLGGGSERAKKPTLERLERMRMHLRISLSLPITGSSLPCSASAVRSRAYCRAGRGQLRRPRRISRDDITHLGERLESLLSSTRVDLLSTANLLGSALDGLESSAGLLQNGGDGRVLAEGEDEVVLRDESIVL